MDCINLTSDDLVENRQGLISPQQRELLFRQRRLAIAGTVAFVLLVVLLGAALLLKLQRPAFADRGQLFLLFPLGLFWLWLLRPLPGRWRQINHDLRQERVSTVEGVVQGRLNLGFGLLQTVKYQIYVEDRSFGVGGDIFFNFQQDETYRIYYTARAGLFLGAQRLAGEPDIPAPVPSPPAPGSTHILLEPLSEREIEVLQLIAAGLSNKEIARQLSLSVNTIKMYTSQLYQKLGVRRRTEAVVRARQLGLLEER